MERILEFKNFEKNYIVDYSGSDSTVTKLSSVLYKYPISGRIEVIYQKKQELVDRLFTKNKSEDEKRSISQDISDEILIRDKQIADYFIKQVLSSNIIGVFNFLGGERRFCSNYISKLTSNDIKASLIESSLAIQSIDQVKIFHKPSTPDASRPNEGLPLLKESRYYKDQIKELIDLGVYEDFMKKNFETNSLNLSEFAEKMNEEIKLPEIIEADMNLIKRILDFNRNKVSEKCHGFCDYELDFFVRFKKDLPKTEENIKSVLLNRVKFIEYLIENEVYKNKNTQKDVPKGIFLKDSQTRDYFTKDYLSQIPVGIYTPSFFKVSEDERKSHGMGKDNKTFSIKMSFEVSVELQLKEDLVFDSGLTASAGDSAHCWVKLKRNSNW